jgi:nicotinate-nucleotide adenylyltransferase
MPPPDRDELPQKSGARVAFFGGSFDPPHLGHLAVARAARAAFKLDAVLFAPVGAQPLKPEGANAGFDDRVAMTRLAIADEPGFIVSLADAPRVGAGGSLAPNYTIETLQGMKTALAADSLLYCLVGADSFLSLRHWHRAREVLFVAPLIVASRPGQPLEGLKAALPPGVTLEPAQESDWTTRGVEVRTFVLVNERGERVPLYVLPGLDVPISATEIRAHIDAACGVPASQSALVPAAVCAYIAQHRLYRS